jgi:hypothetical protein
MRRTIVIGDVHGCRAELDALLDRVALTTDDDLVFVGDLVAKGPDSRGVLAIARQAKARIALGNHEQKLLAAREAARDQRPLPKLDATHERLLAELDESEWAELAALPLSIELPAHDVRVVHAGVVPGIPFERQDPWLVTHMRSISDAGEPSAKWGPLWGTKYEGPPHIVFGHNARKEPQLHAHATGLDTACVYGGELTALILPEGEKLPKPQERRELMVTERARRAYSDYGRELS